jgi:predicted dehydrogenase
MQGFPDLVSAMQQLSPEIVVIATPTLRHAADLKSVLELSRPKAILCEKPLSYKMMKHA